MALEFPAVGCCDLCSHIQWQALEIVIGGITHILHNFFLFYRAHWVHLEINGSLELASALWLLKLTET